MKLTTVLTLTALVLTSTLGLVSRVDAQHTNSHEAQQESVKEQIEGVNQPQGCRPKC